MTRSTSIHRRRAGRSAAVVALVVPLVVVAGGCSGAEEDVRSTSESTRKPASTTTSTGLPAASSTTVATTTTTVVVASTTSVSAPTSPAAPSTSTTPTVPTDFPIGIDSVGPLKLDTAVSDAIASGHLEDEHVDTCTQEIDGTTDDVDYRMPAPAGMSVRVLTNAGKVTGFVISGNWETEFGIRSGMSIDRVASTLRAAGWEVDISGPDDIFGEGRVDALRGDSEITVEPDDSGRADRLALPFPAYCD